MSTTGEVVGGRGAAGRRLARVGGSAWQVALLIVAAIAIGLAIAYGVQDVAQRSINGLISGTYFALGAVGLTLVYGTLKLVNFAHGEFLTFGAYIAFAVNVSAGSPLWVAVLAAIVATAALGILTELTMWRPMRAKNAGLLQLLLMTLGLAFILRYGIAFVAGTSPRTLDVDRVSALFFLDLRVGETELLVVIIGVVTLLAVAAMLRATSLGRQMRALSDNFDLSETTGIDTKRVVLYTWIFAAGLAGLAGVLYTAAIGVMTPNLGFFLLLSLFAAVILGGIGNAYGALFGGLLIGLVQEWATLVFDARWKLAIGFVVLILVLIVRPQGLFGKERTV